MKKMANSGVIVFLVVFISLAPINTSYAEETGPFYISILGGYSFGADLEYDDNHSSSYNLNIPDSWAFGAKFGYTIPSARFFAMELEYLYRNVDIDQTTLVTRGNGITSIEDVHNLMFNFIFKYPGMVQPFLGGGAGFSSVDFTRSTTTQVPGITSTYSSSNTGFTWQLLAGIIFEIDKNFTVDLTYRYLITNTEYGDDYYNNSYYNGAKIELKSNIVTIGLNYHF